jgi:hypothetical protein
MFTHVVFRISTNRKSKAGRPLDAAPVRSRSVVREVAPRPTKIKGLTLDSRAFA